MSTVGHSVEQLTNYSQSYDAWPFVKLPPPVNQLPQWRRTTTREENFFDEADPSLIAQNVEDRMFFRDGAAFADTRQQVMQLLVCVWDSKWATLYGSNQFSTGIIHRDRHHLL